MLTIVNLVGTALVFIAFGLWGLLDPAGMVANLGLQITDPSGATAIRAIYGGFLIGLGAFILFCAAHPDRRRTGLFALLIIVSTILATRLLGWTLDAFPTSLQAAYAGIEAFSVIVTSALLRTNRAQT